MSYFINSFLSLFKLSDQGAGKKSFIQRRVKIEERDNYFLKFTDDDVNIILASMGSFDHASPQDKIKSISDI